VAHPRDPFEARIAQKKRRAPAFEFVLDELAELEFETRPMFGCTAIYVRDRIVLVLRDKGPSDTDNGVWVAYQPDDEASLLRDFPRLSPIELFAGRTKGWRKLSSSSPEFESDVLQVCEHLRRRDPRLGKVPAGRKPKAGAARSTPSVQTAELRGTKPKASAAESNTAKPSAAESNTAKPSAAESNTAKPSAARSKPSEARSKATAAKPSAAKSRTGAARAARRR
jgi:hypothetical protein